MVVLSFFLFRSTPTRTVKSYLNFVRKGRDAPSNTEDVTRYRKFFLESDGPFFIQSHNHCFSDADTLKVEIQSVQRKDAVAIVTVKRELNANYGPDTTASCLSDIHLQRVHGRWRISARELKALYGFDLNY